MAQNTLSALLPLGIIMGALTASGCGLHLVPMLFHGEKRRTLLDSWKFQMFNRDKTIDAMTK